VLKWFDIRDARIFPSASLDRYDQTTGMAAKLTLEKMMF
jgi:hypothetical protein